MHENPAMFTNLIEPIDNESADQCIARLGNEGEFGDHGSLIAVAITYGRDVVVVTALGAEVYRAEDFGGIVVGPPLGVVYNPRPLHYDAVGPAAGPGTNVLGVTPSAVHDLIAGYLAGGAPVAATVRATSATGTAFDIAPLRPEDMTARQRQDLRREFDRFYDPA